MLNLLNTALDGWRAYNNANNTTTRLVVYFTLGFHKGDDPFTSNMCVATDFRDALLETFHDLQPNSWSVVFTCTDATRHSTYPDGVFEQGNKMLTIPSYKITKWNYIYAMSKLGQFFLVKSAVAQLLHLFDINELLVPIIAKIQKNVTNAAQMGDNSYEALVTNYIPTLESESISNRLLYIFLSPGKKKKKKYRRDDMWSSLFQRRSKLLIDDLSSISKFIDDTFAKVPRLREHFMITNGISISYTTLHCKPWTMDAVKEENPRLHIVQQIIYRLKNAISTEYAAALHFPTNDTHVSGQKKELSLISLNTAEMSLDASETTAEMSLDTSDEMECEC